tara:strand:+ start:311 stop:814 length:504 start_codon:yes stop_codon:yes gene_type:complete
MHEEVILKESIFINQYDGDSDIIQSHIDHIVKFDKGRVVSNQGGYQSNNITFGFKDLISFAQKSLSSINIKTKLDSFWFNINKGNDYNHPHIHDVSLWSAVYYHKVCCEKATLNFHHLVPALFSQYHCYVPKEKDMVFFKGIIPHSVSPCKQHEHERISIAMNFNVK